MISNTRITAQPEYDIQFWNAMRNKEAREDISCKGEGYWYRNLQYADCCGRKGYE